MAEDDIASTLFDCIVAGTGLAESILAAALARAGRTVLHIDANDNYGGDWTSLPLAAFEEWASTVPSADSTCAFRCFRRFEWPSSPPPPAAAAVSVSETPDDGNGGAAHPVSADEPGGELAAGEQLREGVQEGPAHRTYADALSKSRLFQVDLLPRVLYGRGDMVELLIASGVGRYLEFKAVDRTFMAVEADGGGGRVELAPVPCSRADVFASGAIGVVEKRVLMKLLSMCAEYEGHGDEWHDARDTPFVDYLRNTRKLSPRMSAFVAHAIAIGASEGAALASTERGLAATRRFLGSLGRYGPTPFLWPMYGTGELAQAFCRTCAVKGGIYILRRGVVALGQREDGAALIRCSEGEFAGKTVVLGDRAYADGGEGPRPAAATQRGYVLRAVVVLEGGLLCPSSAERKDSVQLLTIPPGVASNGAPVHVLSVGHAGAASPAEFSLLHVMMHGETSNAREALEPVVRALVSTPEDTEPSGRPRALAVAYFALSAGAGGHSAASGSPVIVLDRPPYAVDCDAAVAQARRVFEAMCGADTPFLPPESESTELEAPGPVEEAHVATGEPNGPNGDGVVAGASEAGGQARAEGDGSSAGPATGVSATAASGDATSADR